MAEGKPRFPASSGKNPAGLTLDVVPEPGGWSVKRVGGVSTPRQYRTKAEAVGAAKAAMQSSGGALRIHARNGQILESVTLGRRPAAKISAVEGISLDGETRRELEGFDRQGLSPIERRRRIGRKYGIGQKSGR